MGESGVKAGKPLGSGELGKIPRGAAAAAMICPLAIASS